MSDYNGWTNYATWRVNLELIDGIDPADWNDDWQKDQVHDFADYLKEYVEDILSIDGKGIALDYALAFLSDVNWREIAKHKMEEYADEEETEEA